MSTKLFWSIWRKNKGTYLWLIFCTRLKLAPSWKAQRALGKRLASVEDNLVQAFSQIWEQTFWKSSVVLRRWCEVVPDLFAASAKKWSTNEPNQSWRHCSQALILRAFLLDNCLTLWEKSGTPCWTYYHFIIIVFFGFGGEGGRGGGGFCLGNVYSISHYCL